MVRAAIKAGPTGLRSKYDVLERQGPVHLQLYSSYWRALAILGVAGVSMVFSLIVLPRYSSSTASEGLFDSSGGGRAAKSNPQVDIGHGCSHAI